MPSIETINPATNEPLRKYKPLCDENPDEISPIIKCAHEAFCEWRLTEITERCDLLKKLADNLREDKQRLAEIITREMGKPIAESEGEIDKCAWVCEYYAENAEKFLNDLPLESDASKSFAAFEPLGVVLAVMPWNFPFWQVFRFAAPALAAGNTCLLKHASNVSGCAVEIEHLISAAGFPENAFRTLLLDAQLVEQVIRHEKVRAVTLTGSGGAGASVASIAGEEIKKTVLELGGSDPYIVLADADINLAVEKCVASRLINSGQSCIGAKRFIVVEEVKEEFEKAFVKKIKKTKCGDPFKKGVTVGPLARKDLRDNLDAQVQESIKAGARCLTGGKVPEGPGFFYPPTVLTDVPEGSPAYSEEMFGPVAAIIPVAGEEEALEVANATSFGLGSAVFTKDKKKAERFARQLEAGCCFINDFVKSDPRLPFGGIKKSGYGRELSMFGIREFVNIKTIVFA